MKTMQAMMLTGIRKMEMLEAPMPEIVDDKDVLVKMVAVGVCGSDVHYYQTGQIGSQVVEYPFTVGHEGSGIVEQIGSAVTNLKIGDRVAIEPAMPCRKCDQCLVGRPHTCRGLKFLGCPQQAAGCLSEYIVMPEASCFKMRDRMSFAQGAISEPLAIGVYAVRCSVPMPGKNVGILGSGPVGLCVLMAAMAQGVEKLYVTDKLDERLAVAKQAGATWCGNPDKIDVVSEISTREPLLLDVVFECCGEQDALFQAVDILKPGGKLMLIGIPPMLDNWQLPVDQMRHKEICVQNVRRQNGCVQATLDMLDDHAVNVDLMVTHNFDFTQTQKAFELVANYRDGVVKAMVNF
ncbi:MAG: alcohol dehydrogenase catalytic domain-containing protein [Victivallaceae bacterium]|nr:alcohol dehydrogenase catalytic domain-containing protein [Victivallaceae bacterium]